MAAKRRTLLLDLVVGTATLLVLAVGAVLTGAPSGFASPAAAADTRPSSREVGFVEYTNPNDGGNENSAASTVVLTGGIGDFGQAQRVNADDTHGTGGTRGPVDGSELNLVLRAGSFRLDAARLDAASAGILARLPADPASCSGTISAEVAAPIVAGSGTGAYKGIAGVFDLTISAAGVNPGSDQGCGIAGTPRGEPVIVVSGSGSVVL
jgi:hypothetical protein